MTLVIYSDYLNPGINWRLGIKKRKKMHEAIKRERTQLQEIVDLFKAGNLTRVYVVAQDKDGEISEYDFNSAEADLSSPD